MNKISLQTSAILHIPFDNYDKDFTFAVNNKTYQASVFVAELISTTITKLRLNDPTIHEFRIDTKTNGDFQHFLNIINFKQNDIQQTELSFFAEIVDILEN